MLQRIKILTLQFKYILLNGKGSHLEIFSPL